MITRFSSRRARLDTSFITGRVHSARAYDRIAGYFSSSILEVAGEALESIAGRCGWSATRHWMSAMSSSPTMRLKRLCARIAAPRSRRNWPDPRGSAFTGSTNSWLVARLRYECLPTRNDAIPLSPFLQDTHLLAEEFCQLLSERAKTGFFRTLLLRRVGSTLEAGRRTVGKMLSGWEPLRDTEGDEETLNRLRTLWCDGNCSMKTGSNPAASSSVSSGFY